MFLSASFNWDSMIPLVVLLGISVVIPLILSALKLKFIPVLVVEILCGIIIGNIPFIKELFVVEKVHFNIFVDGIYTIGLAVLLFLSGLDVDFSVLKNQKKNNHGTLPVFKISWLLIGLVILVSFGLSFIFINDFVKDDLTTKVMGITLLTIMFSSSFASIIIPLIHEDHMAKTTIGKTICTYSTIAEFISIISLSILMIIRGIVEDSNPWLLIVVLIILILVYIVRKFVPTKLYEKMFGGIVHLDVRLVFLILFVLAIMTQHAGAEFILGTFLAGAIIKATGIKESAEEKLFSIGYGLFVPMFYILVGLKVGVSIPFSEFISPEYLFLIAKVFLALIIAKIPFLLLAKWFELPTVISTLFLVTTTIIVGLACEHFGIFSEQLASAIVVASSLTCLISPVILFLTKHFGYSKHEYDEVVINPDEVND